MPIVAKNFLKALSSENKPRLDFAGYLIGDRNDYIADVIITTLERAGQATTTSNFSCSDKYY